MNRNPITLLCALMVTLFAALAGCGGGDNPQTMSPPVDTGTDADMPDQQVKPDVADAGNEVGNDADPDATCTFALGGHCSPQGAVDPCTGYVCNECNLWAMPGSTEPCNPNDAGPDSEEPDADAGTDAPDDVVEPDAEEDVYVPPDVELPDEVCGNGTDDDGNGKADCQDPACAGEPACQSEVCDGVDNNGNSQQDEGFECKLGATAGCQTSCGSIGTTTCTSGCTWSACAPPAEVCGNNIDDNCNLATDCDDAACINLPQCTCETPSIGDWCTTPYVPGDFHACEPSLRCDCFGKWASTSVGDFSCINSEVCNGHDDNGNGQTDEGFACVMGTSQNCTTSCGSTGVKSCGATCEFGACAPPLELCGNGADDDCDGKADCIDPDCSGLLACQTEVCDGADNNGNGQTDEGYQCIAGSTGSCSTSCGSAGTYQCSATCTKGACIAFENCYAQGDEDCDGKADCADTDCANLPMCVATEVCNGLDDNSNGQVDETFQCIKGSAPVACTTSCGSTGTKACLANCSYGACTPPAEICNNNADDDCDGQKDCADADCTSAPNCGPEDCVNGVDDNGNNLVDCADPGCFADVDCHDFGTCPAQSPSGTGYTCGSWSQDTVPATIYQITGGCANSQYDQWAVGGTWSDGKALHLTGNHTWNEVALPFVTKVNMAKPAVTCLGQNNVYFVFNETILGDGAFSRWNGSSMVRLDTGELTGYVAATVWGSGPNDVWFTARKRTELTDVKVFHWNGSSLTSQLVNPFYPNSFNPMSMWGSSTNDIYIAGYAFDIGNPSDTAGWEGALLHWDGSSWAVIQTPNNLKYLANVHGSSSCDVITTGWSEGGTTGIGSTLQRNGDAWESKTYSQFDMVKGAYKISPAKYVLQGHEPLGSIGRVWMGTPKADSSVNWTVISEDFYTPGSTWAIPGTSPQVIISAGNGNNGPEIYRSTCQ